MMYGHMLYRLLQALIKPCGNGNTDGRAHTYRLAVLRHINAHIAYIRLNLHENIGIGSASGYIVKGFYTSFRGQLCSNSIIEWFRKEIAKETDSKAFFARMEEAVKDSSVSVPIRSPTA